MIVAVGFLVAAAAGATARAAIGRGLNRPGRLAWGTLVINVSGSFALGLLATVSAPAATILGTGLLGAYTTFSSFARDVVAALESRQYVVATVYVVASLALSITAAWLALALVGA